MSPFGIMFGEPPPESFKKLNEHFAYSDFAPNPHPSFAHYDCVFVENFGVAKISGYSDPFENDEYGTSAQTAFGSVEEQLVRKYGKPEHFDFLKSGAIYTEPREWLGSVRYAERTFASIWEQGQTPLPAELSSVGLYLDCDDGLNVKLTIRYEGKNWLAALALIKERQADVL